MDTFSVRTIDVNARTNRTFTLSVAVLDGIVPSGIDDRGAGASLGVVVSAGHVGIFDMSLRRFCGADDDDREWFGKAAGGNGKTAGRQARPDQISASHTDS